MPELSAHSPFVRASTFPAAFALALIIGGGGAEGPLQNGIVSALGAVLLAVLVADQMSSRGAAKGSLAPILLALGLFLIPVAQLLPLPPSLWQAGPGRANAVSALREIGAADGWRPLSLDPQATMLTAAALLFPLATFLFALRADRGHQKNLLRALMFGAGLSGLLGAAQLALGHPDWLSFYDGPSVGAASGIFANPNHQALMMVMGMVASAMLIRSSGRGRLRQGRVAGSAWGWAGLVFFAVMALASGSRAGVMLLAVGLPGALIVARGSGSLLRWTAGLVGILALLWIVVLLYPGTNSLAVRESFRFGEDARYAYLPDILYTLEQYWPVGSGLGTFVEVFAPNENLDLAQRGYLNHAHNDFLEWLIETGMVGAAWLVLAAVMAAHFGYRKLRENRDDLGFVLGPMLMILLAALHSLADYPMRTSAIASIVAFALGCLTASPGRSEVRVQPRSKWIPIAAAVIALPLVAESMRLHLAQWALRTDQPELASQLAPLNPDVMVALSNNALLAGKAAAAEELAAVAITAQPMNPAALRQLVLAREQQGKPAGSVWQLASALGWRDTGTQYWAFRQALLEDEPQVAALRADALLRTGRPSPVFIRLLRISANQPRFASALANRIQLSPAWRPQFFALNSTPSPDELSGMVTILEEQTKGGQPANRADGRALIAHFIKARAFSQAARIDQLVAGPRNQDGNLLDDGGFDRLGEDYALNSTPFDWQVRRGKHASGSIETAHPARLVTDSDGERAEVAAERYLRLPAGRYRLTYQSRSDSPDAFQTRLVCIDPSAKAAAAVVPQSRAFGSRTIEFETGEACAMLRLVIESLPSGSPATAEFDDFYLAPMS